MRKILTIAFVLLLALFTLTACGGGSGSGNNGGSTATEEPDSNGGNESSGADAESPDGSSAAAPYVPVEREVEVPASPLDISDKSIWYVVIDGVKYDLYDVKVDDFLKAGFVFDKYAKFDENTKVDAHSDFTTATEGIQLCKENSKDLVNVYPINLTGNIIPLKECEIKAIWLNSNFLKETDSYIVCNLSIGSTKDEVVSVFGDDYDNVYGASNLVYDKRDERASGGSGSITFTISSENNTVFKINFWLDKKNP